MTHRKPTGHARAQLARRHSNPTGPYDGPTLARQVALRHHPSGSPTPTGPYDGNLLVSAEARQGNPSARQVRAGQRAVHRAVHATKARARVARAGTASKHGAFIGMRCPETHVSNGVYCVPKPKKPNPAPHRASRSKSDKAYGVYHPNGQEDFLTDVNAAQARAQALSQRNNGAPIKVRSYTGDGHGGWVWGQVYGVSTAQPPAATPPQSNPGCTSCMGKMAWMPR